MTSPDQGFAADPRRLTLELGHVVPGVTRAARRHPFVLAALVLVLWGGGVGGGVLALSLLKAVGPAAACPHVGPPYYAYAVPPDPAHVPAAGSGASSWGWQPHIHPLKAGNWVRGMDGHMWKVTGIVAMPGVEPVCRPFGILGLPARSPFTNGLIMAGRLVLGPVGY